MVLFERYERVLFIRLTLMKSRAEIVLMALFVMAIGAWYQSPDIGGRINILINFGNVQNKMLALALLTLLKILNILDLVLSHIKEICAMPVKVVIHVLLMLHAKNALILYRICSYL